MHPSWLSLDLDNLEPQPKKKESTVKFKNWFDKYKYSDVLSSSHLNLKILGFSKKERIFNNYAESANNKLKKICGTSLGLIEFVRDFTSLQNCELVNINLSIGKRGEFILKKKTRRALLNRIHKILCNIGYKLNIVDYKLAQCELDKIQWNNHHEIPEILDYSNAYISDLKSKSISLIERDAITYLKNSESEFIICEEKSQYRVTYKFSFLKKKKKFCNCDISNELCHHVVAVAVKTNNFVLIDEFSKIIVSKKNRLLNLIKPDVILPGRKKSVRKRIRRKKIRTVDYLRDCGN
jgi:hypothetical protein